MKGKSVCIFVVLSLFLLSSLSFFDDTSVRAADTLYVPGDYSTIQAAINAASMGDTIMVAAGTYYENLVINKKIHIVGAGDYKTKTVIDGGGSGSTVLISGIPLKPAMYTMKLEGFYIRNGAGTVVSPYGKLGGGLLIVDSTYVIINSCVMVGNSADYGAGAGCADSSPRFINCVFWNNDADDYGGGLGNGGSNSVVVNCVFWSNSAGVSGGGIANINSDPIVKNSVLWSNSNPEIYKYGSSSPDVSY